MSQFDHSNERAILQNDVFNNDDSCFIEQINITTELPVICIDDYDLPKLTGDINNKENENYGNLTFCSDSYDENKTQNNENIDLLFIDNLTLNQMEPQYTKSTTTHNTQNRLDIGTTSNIENLTPVCKVTKKRGFTKSLTTVVTREVL